MHSQDFAIRAVKPRENHDAISGPGAVEGGENARLEDEPGVGRALVALFGAAAGSVRDDSTAPIGRSSILIPRSPRTRRARFPRGARSASPYR